MIKEHIYNLFYALAFCFIIICIIAFPSESYNAALDGLKLWFNVVCPALLPFFICVEILIGLGLVSFLGGLFTLIMRPIFNLPGEASFAFIMSIASGYPMGAKITAKFRQDNICTRAEGQRMLNFCSTSGPLFIIGAVATGILNNPKIGLLLAICHYLSAITVGFFMRYYKNNDKQKSNIYNFSPLQDMLNYRKKDGRTIGTLMGDAVKNGVNLIMMIGGFIIFFSVIAKVLSISGLLTFAATVISKFLLFKSVTPNIVSSVIIGILEVTNGIKECALVQMPEILRIVLVSFMIGFGGLSINAQVLSVISNTDLKFGLYLVFKVIQGIIASVYTYIIFSFYPAQNVFNHINSLNIANYYTNNLSFLNTFYLSTINLLYMLIFITFLSLLIKVKFKIVRKNYKS